MRSSIEPAIRQRIPPPLWRCGSATPPGSKSTRSQRIRYASSAASSIGCSSRSAPAASGAAPSRISSYRRTVAPRGPTAGMVAFPANEALCSASRVSFPSPAAVRSPASTYRTRLSAGSVRGVAPAGRSSRVRRRAYPAMTSPLTPSRADSQTRRRTGNAARRTASWRGGRGKATVVDGNALGSGPVILHLARSAPSILPRRLALRLGVETTVVVPMN